MQLVDSIISLLAAGLTTLLLLVGQLFPVPQPAAQAPAPAATTTAKTFPSASTTAQKSAQKSSGLLSQASPQSPAGQTSSQTSAPASSVPAAQPVKSQTQINDETRAALVNLLCTTRYSGSFAPISGSGVIIDSRGVIVTNAHVAQYFLLRDYYTPGNVQCIVRMGSPAEPYYSAELLYLPPAWIADNAGQIVSEQAVGTGENDYAFVLITGPVGTRAMPASFPAVALAGGGPSLGEAMLLAAYPAQYLGGEFINKSLYQSSAVAYVAQLFNFAAGNPTDLFSIGGTVVSQAGSSGGAVVSLYDGALKGIISVETVAASTGGRDLRAITLGHINRSLAAEGQGGIVPLLSGDIAAKAAAFNAIVAPAETKALEDALGRQ